MNTQMNIRIDPELLRRAKMKCKDQFGISLSCLVKVFLKSFISQFGVGFCVGDQDFKKLFNQWLITKRLPKQKSRLPGPRLKDLYELVSTPVSTV